MYPQLTIVLVVFAASPAMSAEPVDFTTSIQPLLTKHCVTCHGPQKQRGGLRLDRRADALKGGESGTVIVPGKPSESVLFKLVTHTNTDSRMPPNKPPLAANDIETLRNWIAQGAVWPDDGSRLANAADWWSLKPIVPPTNTSIDQLIRAKLREHHLEPSPEADRRTLIRRLSFDLLGLPPSPEDIDAFVNSHEPNAYEQLVDRLLASPHYGERWARHWLDVVHYGETHGYDKDKPRPNAWPYRDYVIRAFNQDKPYSRFVAEQLAGDVLYPHTVDGVEALGFLAAGPWDFIGHAEVPENKTDGKIARHLDRDDFVANTMGTFVGLTVHCAQCHNHKFDPITQLDYYRLQSVFAAIDRTNVTYDLDPAISAKRQELQVRLRTARETIQRLEDQARTQAANELTSLEGQLVETTSKPAEHGYHSAIAPRADQPKWVQIDLGERVALERIVLKPCHDDFNSIGAGFGFPVRFRIAISDEPNFATETIVMDHTTHDVVNPKLKPFIVVLKNQSARYVRVTATKLARRQNDFIFALSELEAFDAKGRNLAKGKAVTAFDSIEAPNRWRKSNLTDGLAPQEARSTNERAELQQRREKILQTALGEQYPKLVDARNDLRTTTAEFEKHKGQQRTAYIGAVHTGSGSFVGTGASGGRPRPIYVLARGNVTQPLALVEPGAIAAIPGLTANFKLSTNHREGERRAALANWITDRNNPLTWRVMANRVWQYHFGRGIVDTPNDFGKMGQLPTHPELLDFLAADLREYQSLKRLHKLIVLSATYRQQTITHREFSAIDADNRYLWRQNRRKLDAEAVRDSLVLVAGKLDRAMGGPSFQDFVIEKPEHSPHYQYHLHDPNDSRSHRRAIYRFVVRSKQQPFMAALDCADPSLAVEKRNESLAPQQALALLNNRLAVTMAEHFANRVAQLEVSVEGQVRRAYRFALGRVPTANESRVLGDYVRSHGLANACRVIVNLNEFLFVD